MHSSSHFWFPKIVSSHFLFSQSLTCTCICTCTCPPALTAAAGLAVRVVYLDRGEGAAPTSHDFPEGAAPSLHLLYRPGHYDILYPK